MFRNKIRRKARFLFHEVILKKDRFLIKSSIFVRFHGWIRFFKVEEKSPMSIDLNFFLENESFLALAGFCIGNPSIIPLNNPKFLSEEIMFVKKLPSSHQ